MDGIWSMPLDIGVTAKFMDLMALHEVYGFGPDRIDRFRDAMEAVILEYGDLLDSVDADYADEKLERRYKAIMGRNSP